MFGGQIPLGSIVFYYDAMLCLSDCAVEVSTDRKREGRRDVKLDVKL